MRNRNRPRKVFPFLVQTVSWFQFFAKTKVKNSSYYLHIVDLTDQSYLEKMINFSLVFLLAILSSKTFFMVESSSQIYGIIYNVSLLIYDENATIVNGTCEECICLMCLNQTYSSFNCDRINRLCFFNKQTNETQTFRMIPNFNSTFYFLSLPTATDTTTGIRWYSH